LAKCWFLSIPPDDVIQFGEVVNKRVEQLIEETDDSGELNDRLSNAILYALKMGHRPIDWPDSFVSLVRTISKRMGDYSIESKAGNIPLKRYPRYRRQWDTLVQRIDLLTDAVGGEPEGPQA
jgi:hypothetical protein